jgi:hypothetical protein
VPKPSLQGAGVVTAFAKAKPQPLSRDYLDENGGGQSEFEAAAGSEVMIGLSPEVRKHFFWVSVFDCR